MIYDVKVTRIEDFGAFAEYAPNKEALIHVSELENYRVNHPSDILSVGEELQVKVVGFDRFGKPRMSRKALLPEQQS